MKQSKTCYRNLGEFVADLKRAGEIKIITRPVSAHLEISRFTDEQSKSPQGGKALYFENVKGSSFPAATNLFGSSRRIGMAMGVEDLDELGARLRALIEMAPPRGLKDVLGLLPTVLSVARFFPRRSRAKVAPCQQVVHTGADVDLSQLPVLHCWPRDAGPFITLPLVFTRSPVSGKGNVGMYRLQVFDKNTTGMHWHIHKDGSHFYNEYSKLKRRMPVSVAIGADPATIYAATAPMPRNVDELILAGFIRNRPVMMTQCITNDLRVPAEAEFVLEGYVEPGELRREGPFGDHTGYYSLADDYPVFHVTALTHRRNPLYCATLVGRPPMEDCYLAKATERLFLPLLQAAFPEVVDYWLPWEGVFHNIVVVAIEKEFPGHAQKVMHGLWGQGQMSFCKAIVVVDKKVDLKQPVRIIERLLAELDVASDLTLTKGVLDVLDHSAPSHTFGSKVGIDLTTRFPGEPARRHVAPVAHSTMPIPDELAAELPRALDGVKAARCFALDRGTACPVGRNRVLLVQVERNNTRTGSHYAEALLSHETVQAFNLMVLFDRTIDLNDHSLMLWKVFNNVDPERDFYVRGNRLVIDACIKHAGDGHLREWPAELTFE